MSLVRQDTDLQCTTFDTELHRSHGRKESAVFSIPSALKRARTSFFLSHEELLKENIKKVLISAEASCSTFEVVFFSLHLILGKGCRGGTGMELSKVEGDKFFLGSWILECSLH